MEKIIEKFDPWIKAAIFCAGVLKKFHGEKIVARIRRRASLNSLIVLHQDVTHQMRSLAVKMQSAPDNPTQEYHRSIIENACSFCKACADAMAHVSGLGHNDMNCSLHVLTEEDGKDCVHCLARWNNSRDERSEPKKRPAKRHYVSENTTWASLLGLFDGRVRWMPVRCFCCNDLVGASDKYNCSLDGWQSAYKSKLAFPLRYENFHDPSDRVTVGFLVFDSPVKDAFPNMPNILEGEHYHKTNVYHNELHTSAIFHFGAVIADSLAACLRPYYERQRTRAK